MEVLINGVSRRRILDKQFTEEKECQKLIDVIENIGSDPLLTEAEILVQKAQNKISDYIDNNICDRCANNLDNGICAGDEEHGWVDKSGELKCFKLKEVV